MAKYTLEQHKYYDDLKKSLHIGDIILTSTNNFMYETARGILKVTYDHVSVLIGEDQLIHISWPKIRVIHPLQLISHSQQLRVIRPALSQSEVLNFTKFLSTSLDQNYDVYSFLRGVWRKLFQEYVITAEQLESMISNTELGLRKKQVCTDLVFYALIANSAEFRSLLKNKIHALDFQIIGSFTPDDFEQLFYVSNYFTHIALIKQEGVGFRKMIKEKVSKYFHDILILEESLIKGIKIPQVFQIHKMKIENVYELVEFILIGFNLIDLISLPREIMVKKILQLTMKKMGVQKQKKAFNQVYDVVQILILFNKKKSIKNSIKLIKHLRNLVSVSNRLFLNELQQRVKSLLGRSKL